MMLNRLASVATSVALLLTPQLAAAASPILATKLFEASSGTERNAIAYDAATERLYTVNSADMLTAYEVDGDGTPVLGPLPVTIGGLDVPGRSGEVGIHFIEEATTIGGVGVAAGSLLFIQAGQPPLSTNETTLYALDETTAAATTSEVVTIGLIPPTSTCPNSNVLKDQAKGLGYSIQRNLLLSVSMNCNAVAEIDSGSISVTGSFDVPGGILPSSGGAGVAVHPVTGHTWLGGPLLGGDNRLAEFSEEGVLLQQLNVLDTNGGAAVPVRRLTFDPTGQRLFMLTFSADVYELAGPLPEAVPALGPWGLLVLSLGLGLGALSLGQRSRALRAKRALRVSH
jgi:hypothetical protein